MKYISSVYNIHKPKYITIRPGKPDVHPEEIRVARFIGKRGFLRVFYLVLFIVLFGISCMAQSYRCLPSNVKETDIFEVRTLTSKPGKSNTEKITVKDKLDKMQARCAQGKLVDGKGRQIRFYFVQGCWGSPPDDYLEIQERQIKEMERLKKRYTVIEMTCNREGMTPPS